MLGSLVLTFVLTLAGRQRRRAKSNPSPERQSEPNHQPQNCNQTQTNNQGNPLDETPFSSPSNDPHASTARHGQGLTWASRPETKPASPRHLDRTQHQSDRPLSRRAILHSTTRTCLPLAMTSPAVARLRHQSDSSTRRISITSHHGHGRLWRESVASPHHHPAVSAGPSRPLDRPKQSTGLISSPSAHRPNSALCLHRTSAPRDRIPPVSASGGHA